MGSHKYAESLAMIVFFYGMYMDATLLESMGHAPIVVGAARLDGYRLVIGDRATLVPAEGKSCYGNLIDLSDDEAKALYSRPEVQGYAPMTVTAALLSDSSQHMAQCFVLSPIDVSRSANAEYAAKLSALVRRLGLPEEYAQEIEWQGNP